MTAVNLPPALDQAAAGQPYRVYRLGGSLPQLDAALAAPGTFCFGTHFPIMPRYFFNVRHERSNVDTEGEELRDKHAAWHEATIIAGELLRDIDGKLKPGKDLQLEVTDEFRNRLYMICIIAEDST